jgi:hypothetical protein
MFIRIGRIGQRRTLRSTIQKDTHMLERIKKLLDQVLAPRRPVPVPVPVPVRTTRRTR